MPQVLVIGAADQFCFDVQDLADEINLAESGIRVKSTTSGEIASAWLKMGGFGAVVFDPGLEFDLQSQLASLLWEKDLVAPFILYGPDKTSRHDAQSRLMGSTLYFGADAKNKLIKTLQQLSKVLGRPGTHQQLKVAVVEDLDSPRDIICTYLEGIDNLQTIGFPDADSCLQALAQEPEKFDFIITDIRMPKKSGAELIEAIRADPKLSMLPIIVLTAYGTADIMIECLKAGATGFMVKPPKKKDLKHEISRVRRILAFGMDPRMVFPHEVDKMQEMLASKGLF